MIIGLKMWPQEQTQGFSKISLSDLVLNLTIHFHSSPRFYQDKHSDQVS